VTSFPDTLAAISRDVDGDLAFANIETVVTDRNDLVPESKGKDTPFHFRSHPMALKAMMDAGFNLFALANNHSMDYGGQCVEETLYHFAIANIERPIAFAGIGSNSEERPSPPASTSTECISALPRPVLSPETIRNIALPLTGLGRRLTATAQISKPW
jgi:hypothetical protein